MDGDSRGGAALSVREVSGKPIKFIGTGEKLEALEPFYPERMAQRVLGMGDLLTLYEKAQAAIKVRTVSYSLRALIWPSGIRRCCPFWFRPSGCRLCSLHPPCLHLLCSAAAAAVASSPPSGRRC